MVAGFRSGEPLRQCRLRPGCQCRCRHGCRAGQRRSCRRRRRGIRPFLGDLSLAQPHVPQHGKQQAEAEQRECPGNDRDRSRSRPVRKLGSGRVQRVSPGRDAEQDEQGKPRVAARQQAGAAQRQDRSGGDDQHRIEDQRVQPGQRRGYSGRERNRVNPRIRENERGGRQHKDAADDGNHRENTQCAVEVHGMRCSRRELVTHRAAAFLPGAMLAPAPSPYSRERERPLAAGRHATAAPPGAARPLPPAGNPSGETGARMTNGEQAEPIRAISALGETLCRITG